MPNVKDLCWGARSGIQKAIRREDIGLADFCFDLLWNDTKHWQWFVPHRIAAIVAEDCWQFGGELALTMAHTPKQNDELYKHWRKFILRLAAYPSDKEAAGLLYLVLNAEKWNIQRTDKEWLALRELCELVKQRLGKPELLSLSADIMPICSKYFSRRLTNYENAAVHMYAQRMNPAGWGGFWSDKMTCLAAIVLIYSRGLVQAEVKKTLQNALKKQHITRHKDLPWYCYDQHTFVGKRAIKAVLSSTNGITQDNLHSLLFLKSSAIIPRPSPMWEEVTQRDLEERFGSLTDAETAWKKYQPIVRQKILWSASLQ